MRADRIFAEVAERCRALEHSEWLGFTLFWRGNTVFYRRGDLVRGAKLMREALDVLGPDSPRRSTVLDFYGEVLTDLGDWEAAEAILSEALELADRDHYAKTRAYVGWCWHGSHRRAARLSCATVTPCAWRRRGSTSRRS
jgi:tetratricopeptide (TPR) repeat protein